MIGVITILAILFVGAFTSGGVGTLFLVGVPILSIGMWYALKIISPLK